MRLSQPSKNKSKTNKSKTKKSKATEAKTEDSTAASTSKGCKPVGQLANTARIPEKTRRFVFKRDGYQCTYENESGKRCPGRKGLECDHIILRVHGGTNSPENLRTLCRLHNRLHAENALGVEFVSEKIRSSQLKSAARKAAKALAAQMHAT
jgi:5-methylcytosine-specific restriction endonuclease McrA